MSGNIPELDTACLLLFGADMDDNSQGRIVDAQTYQIIGAALEVHRVLGCGFLEPIYRAALAVEFTQRGIPFETERSLPATYKTDALPFHYRVDFVCFDAVIVEVKALRALSPLEEAQAINYLRLSGLGRALLLNFGATSLQYRRVVGPAYRAETESKRSV